MMEKFRKFGHLTLTAMVALASVFGGLIGAVEAQTVGLNLPRIPWEGGPAYWARFPKATAAGWTDPNFFPISVFLPNPGDATALRALGINLAMGVNHDVSDTSYNPRILKMTDPDRNPATEDGLFAMPHKEYETDPEWTNEEVGNDYRTVAWFITDECEMGYSGCGNGEWTQYQELSVQTDRTNVVRAYSDGRFVHSNFGNGVARTFWSPDTMDEHTKLMDSSSVDKYAYTSPDVGGPGGVIATSRNWPRNANAMTSAAYGWIVDQMRIFQKAEPSPGDPTPAEPEGLRPAWAFVETAMPLLGEAGARTITPEQMEGAVWQAIIHEARGVTYFPQNNDACGGYSILYVDSQTSTCLQQLQARQNKLIAMHAKIRSLAPVINSQSYVWNFSNDGIAANNADTMLKAYNGYTYIFAGIGLEYTGRDQSDCDIINLEQVCQALGTNQPAGTKNFILPPGIIGTTVEVVGENRTLPVVNGQFTDNFPNEYTHHVYKIALDPNATPTPTPTPTATPPPTPTTTPTPTPTPTLTPGQTITMGETNIVGGTDSGNGNLLLAQQATLSQTVTLQSLSFYVRTASGNLRLGVYDATGPGGGPGRLKAQTNSFTPVTGWNTQNVTSPVSLPAGTYWLAYLPSSSSLSFANAGTGSFKYYSYTFGPMPATFSTTPASGTDHWSLYATLNTGTTPTPTPTPTPDTQAPSVPTGTR